MAEPTHAKLRSAVFITFSGNCKKALTFYRSCFGGTVHFENFDKELKGFSSVPVVSGSLVSESISIHGSDLVHNEGRKTGNYMSIFLNCETVADRIKLVKKLQSVKPNHSVIDHDEQKLVEVTDAFDVRWVLAVRN